MGAQINQLSAPAPLKILRRARHQDALDPLSAEMLEVPRVVGQKIVGLALNSSQQNWRIPSARARAADRSARVAEHHKLYDRTKDEI